MIDDDRLLDVLRERAYDPARCFDNVGVSREWLDRHHPDLIGSYGGSATSVWLPAGSWAAREYYQDVPGWVPLPPATSAQVTAVEQVLGRPLPELLRRMYTEIAIGGFGPGTDGFPYLIADQSGPYPPRSVPHVYEDNRRAGLPEWVELAPAGCSCYWYVSLAAPYPVYYYDWDAWDNLPGGPPPEQGIYHVAPTLAEWLWRWVEGRHLQWDEYGLQQGDDGFPFGPYQRDPLPDEFRYQSPVPDPWEPCESIFPEEPPF
ncbi:SMI1/KNR4 family protein [Microtetraspora malaysiensis]|uniref:SMI1/KNR4 family protein n=1 Tax=Microtetraspora malaysiensis TaxID=161358 RepID=UPI003D9294C6